jgi:hypothetical protein
MLLKSGGVYPAGLVAMMMNSPAPHRRTLNMAFQPAGVGGQKIIEPPDSTPFRTAYTSQG